MIRRALHNAVTIGAIAYVLAPLIVDMWRWRNRNGLKTEGGRA